MPTIEEIRSTLLALEHPEIAEGLGELGMLRDITYDEESNRVSIVLVLPLLGIPEQIRDYILKSIVHALKPLGVADLHYEIAQMDDAARERFFTLANAAWKG